MNNDFRKKMRWLIDGFFYPIDLVQNGLEKACQWFQKMTGLTNYWIMGKTCLVCAFTLMAGYMRSYLGIKDHIWITAHGTTNSFLTVLAGIGVLMFLFDAHSNWKKLETRAFVRLYSGLANPEKQQKMMRFYLLFSCWLSLYMLALMLAVYLRTCDPLPPCTGKVKEWWDARHKQLIPAKQEG